MEARFVGAPQPRATRSLASLAATIASCSLLVASVAAPLHAAGYRTVNFTVSAPTAELAKEIGDSAEAWRKQLALDWLGRELPRWGSPCPIKAQVAPHLGAGGATSFVFDHGEVFGWDMKIQGSRERVLDSVLPHEITHTIFATHFRQPLPRWADEGACTTVEHTSEVSKQERMLLDFLKVAPGHPGRGIPFSTMFAMKEYPPDVLPLYAQGHSLAVYLIGQKGKHAFLNFLADGMQDENWPRAVREHYGYQHLLALQTAWLDWVKAGRPPLHPALDGDAILASAAASRVVPASTAPAAVARVPDSGPHTAAVAAPSPDDAAAITPTPMSAAYGDWSTRPIQHAMNAPPQSARRAGSASDATAWR
jgi:hypothetical protein